jgi:hypothetical protein
MEHHCSTCPFFCLRLEELIGHVVKKHRTDSEFNASCNFPGCGASYKNYLSFKKHVYRKHRQDLSDHNDGDTEAVCEQMCQEEVTDNSDDSPLIDSEAAFILRLRAHHNLSNNAVNEIMETVKVLYQERMKKVKLELKSHLCGYVNIDTMKVFNTDDMFSGLDSEYRQDKFFETWFGLNEARPVMLGKQFVARRERGRYRVKQSTVNGYFVPFLKQLESLLSMPEVEDALHDSRGSSNFVTDVSCGSYVSSHEIVLKHPDTLLFHVYYDDYEIANPIGSHRKKHKQGVFYWQLLNIPPKYCS